MILYHEAAQILRVFLFCILSFVAIAMTTTMSRVDRLTSLSLSNLNKHWINNIINLTNCGRKPRPLFDNLERFIQLRLTADGSLAIPYYLFIFS